MRHLALCAAAASLVLLAGCGGDPEEPDIVAPDVSDPATSAAVGELDPPGGDATVDPSEPAAGGVESEPAGEVPGQTAGGEPSVLTGSVGTPEDPEAFVITLVDSTGEPVTSLPAGDYVIEVSDPATIHNFHLMGGSVDETTSVPEVEETTFEVTLEAGDYRYVCDPHPQMSGSFTVT